MPKEKKKSGSPAWMATFADMSTLLLTFFVIMLSMATVDVMKFKEMLGSVKEAFGVTFETHGEYRATIQDEVTPPEDPGQGEWQQLQQEFKEEYYAEVEAAAEAAEEREKAAEEIQKQIDQSQMGDQIEVSSGDNGIRIRVKGALLFGAGQADLMSQAVPFLDALVQVMNKFTYYLLVEGHTDSTPISTDRFPSNWELSSHRASVVLRYLIYKGINPGRLTSVGLGATYPLASNDTPEGRAANRRVEFILTEKPFRPVID